MNGFQTLAMVVPTAALIFVLHFFYHDRVLKKSEYSATDLTTNAVLAIGYVVANALSAGFLIALYDQAYRLRFFDLRPNWWSIPAIFLLDDLCYYGFHRASHRVRIWWASHVVHHSSTLYNLSIGMRQSWTGRFAGQPLFWLPLCLVGVPTEWIVWQGCVSVTYQFWIHCEGIGRLPAPVAFLLNTPHHHRVHHASDTPLLDKNFGGVLIIWDRLFGTFAEVAPSAPMRYGLVKNFSSTNVLLIAFHDWLDLCRELKAAASIQSRLRLIFGPPA